MGKVLFIAGTDTGVGKTIVTGLTARCMAENGVNVVTQKWVQTGMDGSDSDISRHLELMDKRSGDLDSYRDLMLPYSFRMPASPHLASRLENMRIDKEKIKISLRGLEENFDAVIVEGTGGVMVPLDEENLMLDLVSECGMPVLLVADNRLGAINHTLLSLDVLKRRGIELIGVVFNQSSPEVDPLIAEDNPGIIQRFSGADILAKLPNTADMEKLYTAYREAAGRIVVKMGIRTHG